MKRYLCVWFPDWPLIRLRRVRRGQRTGTARLQTSDVLEPQHPFALFETKAQRLCIVVANEAAQKLGVGAGLALADAKARAPNLAVKEIDRRADAKALHRVAEWLIRFSPLVALHGDDGLMLETTGCDHLYGSEHAMLETLSKLLNQNALPHQLGLAGTQGAASALAHSNPHTCLKDGEEQPGLADLPVEALRLSTSAETLLRRFGLTRIGQLYGIDRKALARRFQSKSTAEAVQLRLDQALGYRHEPITPIRPVPLQSVRLNCPEPIMTCEAIHLGLESLARSLCQQLSAAGIGAQQFCLLAFKSDGTLSMAEIKTARPVRTAEHILSLFRDHIEKIDPGFGIDLLVFEAHRTDAMEISPMALSGDLATADTDEVALSALADRIVAKLGQQAVRILHPQESYIPERAEQVRQYAGSLPIGREASPCQGPRPVRIFNQPERVTVIAEVPDGPPLRFLWRRIPRVIIRADGPERISPEWWTYVSAPPPTPPVDGAERKWINPKMDPRADAVQIAQTRAAFDAAEPLLQEPVSPLPRARDYYRVEDSDGRRYWLFRDGLYADGRGGPPEWYIHGLFA